MINDRSSASSSAPEAATAASPEPPVAGPSWWDGLKAEFIRFLYVLPFAIVFSLVLAGFGVLPWSMVVYAAPLLAIAGYSLVRNAIPVASAEGRQAVASAGKHPAPQHMDSYREVVETVVFVVVLVLLLKSFAAEAFVIPTGSMAETLYGYQKMVDCPQCGYHFPVNCSSEVDPSEGRPRPVFGCTCPNCQQEIFWDFVQEGRNLLPADYAERHPEAMKIPNPGWHSGDRVLVSKFAYDLLQRIPDRLDVVVFKYPGDSDFPRSGPNKNLAVPMNYIKRLVGEPGETIAVHGGNLYRLPPEKAPHYPEADGGDDPDPRKRASSQKLLWRAPNMHEDYQEALDQFRLGHFQIIRKKPAQINAMKRIVYDNDHPAKDLVGVQRWTGEPAWKAESGAGFKAAPGAADADVQWLRYHHILRGNRGKPSLITDFMGYNSWDDGSGSGHRGNPGENWVGDLILECEAVVDQPAGELVLELVKGVDRFQARWDLAAGTCTLVRVPKNGKEEVLETKPSKLKAGGHRLRLANVDERLTLWVDDDLVFGDGVIYPAASRPDTNHPDLRVPQELPTDDDLKPAGIGVRGAGVTVRHLRLFRDTYYTVKPSFADVDRVNFLEPGTWADQLTTLPLKTLYVQPGHFLCLGDNSPESSDGRSWGLVPERLLLGRALLVYYPLNRAGRIR